MKRISLDRLPSRLVCRQPGLRIACAVILGISASLTASSALALNLPIFTNSRIGFAEGQSREIQRTITFPTFGRQHKLTFNWDILADADPWDRAGSIHAILPDGKQVQLGKFITGFNGTTHHSQDISDLAPILSGKTLPIEAHIDTWVADAWRLNAVLSIDNKPAAEPNPTWGAVLISRDSGLGWHDSGDVIRSYRAAVPTEMENVKLTYFASGHHHNQTNASDEFNQRVHRLYVNGVEVWSGIPWRTDGPNFRDVNPTSGRWDGNGDGDTSDPYPIDYWSSDFPRSGWVPGDEVTPYEIDLTPYMSGRSIYRVDLKIEGVDINSFWRVSGYLSGTPVAPQLPGDFNKDGVVDAADYTVWREQLGMTDFNLAADADVNGRIDQADYQIWRQNYGQSLSVPTGSPAPIPEPAALGLAVFAALASTLRRRTAKKA